MKGEKPLNRLLVLFKISISLIFVFLLIHGAVSKGFAHKVNIFAYIEGDTVFTESYFNDGRKCIDSKIEVFDNTGDKLLEGLTNKDGEFSFQSPGKIDLRLVLTAGMGHKAQYDIKMDEFSDSEEDKAHTSLQPSREDRIDKRKKQDETITMDMKEMQSMIEESLDKKLRPILKLIAKSQQKRVSFTEVIGGIGYIIGIMGIILYFQAKKDKNG